LSCTDAVEAAYAVDDPLPPAVEAKEAPKAALDAELEGKIEIDWEHRYREYDRMFMMC
jgi:hypothetical protein